MKCVMYFTMGLLVNICGHCSYQAAGRGVWRTVLSDSPGGSWRPIMVFPKFPFIKKKTHFDFRDVLYGWLGDLSKRREKITFFKVKMV